MHWFGWRLCARVALPNLYRNPCLHTHQFVLCVLMQVWTGMQDNTLNVSAWATSLNSCCTYKWVMARAWVSHVTHMNESYHTYECITRMNGSWCYAVYCVWVSFVRATFMCAHSYVQHMNWHVCVLILTCNIWIDMCTDMPLPASQYIEFVALCRVVLCYVVLCCVVMTCVVLRCIVLCCAVLRAPFGSVARRHFQTPHAYNYVAWPLLLLMCNQTHSYLWHDHSYMWHDHLYMWHDSVVCVTWLIRKCDMTHAYVRHDSFVCATWHISICDMNHSYVRQDWLIFATWLIYMWDMSHPYV